MKNFLLPLFLLFNLSFVIAQDNEILKFRSTALSLKFINSDGNWGEWEEPKKTEVLVVVDLTKNRIKVYSKETQIYDIASDEGMKTYDNGDEVFSFYCVDHEGIECRVQLWIRPYLDDPESKYFQLLIFYSDVAFYYDIEAI